MLNTMHMYVYGVILEKGFLTSKSLMSCRLMDDDMINKPSQLHNSRRLMDNMDDDMIS